MCNSGNSVIVWLENYNELYYQLMDQNNCHIGMSTSIATSVISGGFPYDVGMDSIGDFSVVWANRETQIMTNSFQKNGKAMIFFCL